MKMNPELRHIRDVLKPYGYVIVQARKHYKIVNGRGAFLASMSITPSCNHWHKNVLADLRRRGHIE